jgi:hypothetical protein
MSNVADIGEVLAGRLRGENNVWLCTVRPDGSPHLTPIWFVYEADSFWVCTGRTAAKTRNLREHPSVAIGLEDGNRPVVAEGVVVVHSRPYPSSIVEAFMSKFGWDIEREDDPDGPFDALWQMRVERWLLGGPDA